MYRPDCLPPTLPPFLYVLQIKDLQRSAVHVLQIKDLRVRSTGILPALALLGDSKKRQPARCRRYEVQPTTARLNVENSVYEKNQRQPKKHQHRNSHAGFAIYLRDQI
jgi:hypothetical protein